MRKKRERKYLLLVARHTIASSFERQGKPKCNLLEMVLDNFFHIIFSTKELTFIIICDTVVIALVVQDRKSSKKKIVLLSTTKILVMICTNKKA